VNAFSQALAWLRNPAHWSGAGGILTRLSQHIEMFAVVMVIACAIGLPLGLWIGHRRRGEFLAVNAAGIGRALPSFGILAFVFPFALRYFPRPFGYWPTLVALVFLALPPLVTNAYVGVRNADPDIVDAARGMGMSDRQILLSVELPMAGPLIMATLRLVAVQVIATATLGAVVGWGGLGRFVVTGIAIGDTGMLLGGALLVAALAILADLAFALLAKATAPGGVAAQGAPGRGKRAGMHVQTRLL
jgi:osmoprotectant transport system permease protein